MPNVKLRLMHVNLAIAAVAVAILLFLAIQSKLVWAFGALRLYASGSTTTPVESLLETEARNLLNTNGNLDEIEAVLDRAVAIDPHGLGFFLLGEVYQRRGDHERALRQFEHYRELRPDFLPVYMHLDETLTAMGRLDERDRMLAQAVDFFTAEVERYQPIDDGSVAQVFNEKARATYNSYHEAITVLKALREPNPTAE